MSPKRYASRLAGDFASRTKTPSGYGPEPLHVYYNRAALGSAGDLTGALVANKYELLRLIGRGGMGAVYEARNVTTFRRCAVKVLLSPELAADGEVVKRFFREARASGLIESEHVVAAFDSGIDESERAYYVMECLLGEDLEQTLDRLGQLEPLTAVKIVLQAATGLASAHALGIVHRDVKPANLFVAVAPGGELKIKILDFGVAKVKMELFNESSNALTHSGSLLGTPLYMSPEQLRRASDIDESADVWSLGVVLFECLTGELPWGDCDGIGELVTAILTARVPHVQDLAPWVEPQLAAVVQSALSRDPGLRLESAAELRDALQQLVSGDRRLYLEDIRPPDEQRRKSQAPRLSLPDTVMIGPTPHSGMPVVRALSNKPPRGGVGSLRLALGAGALATGVWFFAKAPATHGSAPALAEAPLAAASERPPAISTAQVPLPSDLAHEREGPPSEPHPSPASASARKVERRPGVLGHGTSTPRPGPSSASAASAPEPKPPVASSPPPREAEPNRSDAPPASPRLSEVFE